MSIRLEKVPTGLPGLDQLTLGGLPKGRTTLITGKSGAAKSILALQLACSFARRGLKTVVMAVEEAPEDLVSTGDGLGFGLSELVKAGKLHITDMTRPTDGMMVVTGDYDVTGLVHRIDIAVKELGAARSRQLGEDVDDRIDDRGIEHGGGQLVVPPRIALAPALLGHRRTMASRLVGAGLGVSYVNVRGGNEASGLYSSDLMEQVPLSAGLEFNSGALTAGLRGTYRVLVDDNFADAAVPGDASGGLLDANITVGGRF